MRVTSEKAPSVVHGATTRFGLQTKLLLSLVGLVALSGALMIYTLTRRSTAFLDEQARTDINRNLIAFELLMEKEMSNLHSAGEMLLRFPQLSDVVAAEDRQLFAESFDEVFQGLQKDFGLSLIQFSNNQEQVFYHWSESQEMGVDVITGTLISQVWEEGTDVVGFVMTETGALLVSGGPIYHDGKVVGVLEVGKIIDSHYLDQIKEQLGVNLTIFSENKRIATTVQTASGERAIGTTIDKPEILKTVLLEGGRWAGRLIIVGTNDIYGAYTALRGIDGSIIGMLFAGDSAVVYDTRKREDIISALILLLFCLAISSVLALFLSSRIVGPVNELAQTFTQISTGDFTVEVRDYGSDEIGLIGRAVKNMVKSNALLYEQLVKEKQHVAVINDIAKIVNSSLDVNGVFPVFSRQIKNIVTYDNCLIVLPDGDNLAVFLNYSTGAKKLSKKLLFPVTGSVFEWIKAHDQSHLVRDLAKEKHFSDDDALLESGVRSAIRIPIYNHGEIVGLFILTSLECNSFTENDITLLEPVAEHLGMALEKHFLFEKVLTLSQTDELTSLGNRRFLQQELEKEMRRAKRYGREMSVIMVDLDHFKNINDNFGHLAGDQILCQLANLFTRSLRDIDLCARYGGEEFVMILPETGVEGAFSTASKIRETIERFDFLAGGASLRVTVSIGVAAYPLHAKTVERLLGYADAAMYLAKQTGRNKVCVYGIESVSDSDTLL